MKYSITFRDVDYKALTDYLLSGDTERAAYILCRPSISDQEVRLIARKIIPIDDFEESSAVHIKIPSKSVVRALKSADDSKECFVFVHSHPSGIPNHSAQDDREEKELFRTAYNRISTSGVHGSIVFSSPENPRARIFLQGEGFKTVSVIRVIGNRFRFYYPADGSSPNSIFFDRQIRAFGSETQNLLSKLKIGIVGLGGTGSAVAEQLVRLGVGSLVLFDGQELEKSNVNRVYGSRAVDAGVPKVKIMERLIADIGFNTGVKAINKSITIESIAKELKECDVIFGCTDGEAGRSILNKIAIYYAIPVFDMGVKIDSIDGTIRAIEGRVTTLMPGAACLFCRERIDPTNIRAESLESNNPGEATALRREGYIPGLNEPDPAVIPFTTAIASSAVSEFINKLTGYLGEDRKSTEIIHRFHDSRISTNSTARKQDCNSCSDFYIGRADVTPFLDLTWGTES